MKVLLALLLPSILNARAVELQEAGTSPEALAQQAEDVLGICPLLRLELPANLVKKKGNSQTYQMGPLGLFSLAS
jgi:hypothetical protein